MPDRIAKENDFRFHIQLENSGEIVMLQLWEGVVLAGGSIRQAAMQNPGTMNGLEPKINFCLRGRCEVLMPDEQYIYMESGLVYYGYSLTPETFYYPGNVYDYVELFTDNKGHEILAALGLDMPPLTPVSETKLYQMNAELFAHVQDLRMHILARDRDLNDYRFLLMQLIYELKHGYAAPLENADFTTRGQRHIITEAERMLTADLSKRTTVNALAEQFGVSPSTFKLYFERIYGVGVSAYMKQKRMELARHLLTDSRCSVGEISLACGYANPGKFSEVFRKENGITPLEYRRRSSGKEQSHETK